MNNDQAEPSFELIEHLKLIQGIVDRLSRNSFAIKATASAVTAGLIAIIVGQTNAIAGVGSLSLLTLWMLDSYYLSRERAYRALYERVRTTRPGRDEPLYFCLDLHRAEVSPENVLRTAFATVLLLFHPPLLIATILVAMISTS